MASWDKDKAIEHLNKNARAHSHGLCARYTREAIEAGGLKLTHTTYAKDYGPSLSAVGFWALDPSPLLEYLCVAGDVVIIQGFPGETAGHMAMFNGDIWVSDFKQREMYPGPSYRKHQPAYTIYRYFATPWITWSGM